MKIIFTLLLLLANFSFCISQTKIVTKEKPLFVVNNEIVFESLINEIDPNIIESVIVLKNEKAVGKYGDKGKKGLIWAANDEGNIIRFDPGIKKRKDLSCY